MRTIRISNETYEAILIYQRYLHKKQGTIWTFDTLINAAITNDYAEALRIHERKDKSNEE